MGSDQFNSGVWYKQMMIRRVKAPNFMERKIVKEEFILQKALYRKETTVKKARKQQLSRERTAHQRVAKAACAASNSGKSNP